MSFEEAVLTATTTVLDWDLPPELLPLTITNEANMLAKVKPGLSSEMDWN